MYQLKIKCTENVDGTHKGVEITLDELLASLGITGPAVDTGSLVFNDIPVGSIDGINNTFTLSYAPVASTILLYKNGLLQTFGNDYGVLGTQLIFEADAIPLPGDSLIAGLYLKV